MHCKPGIGHFQSDKFSFRVQIARSQQFMVICASCLAAVQALGCKCISCDGEFESKCAAVCHCSHPTYIGTVCADPSNIQSLSLTQCLHVSDGILFPHSTVPLGALMYILLQPFTSCISYFNHRLKLKSQ